jgi:hypothetical protein
MESRLKDIHRRFMDVEAGYRKTGEIEARARLAEIRRDFAEKRKEVESKLGEVRKAGAAALHETQEGAAAAWTELTDAMDRAKDELAELRS